jgi:putative nucleotidyltransferase with HDIG domain
MNPATLPTDRELSPAVEELLTGFDEARGERLTGRERRVESLVTALFAAAMVVLVASFAPVAPPLATAAVLVVGYAIALRVCFPVGAGYAAPTQLFLIPMLLLVPPVWAPLLVMSGIAAAHLPDYLRGAKHPDRALLIAGDSLHAIAPALVLAAYGSGAPAWSDWTVYLVALLASVVSDFAATAIRERLALGVRTKLQLGLHGWICLVDLLLAPIGLVLAFAAADGRPAAVLLGLPLVGLLALFAVERRQRVEHALELSRAYRGTTLLLNDVLDADDAYTASHSRDVVSLSVAVANEMGLDDSQCQRVEFGALLHDIGKIAVPNEIINKDGPLTEDEWVVIKTHTVEGQKMLDKVGGVMGDVGRIVRSSHENWDGTGYPDRLAGDRIPLEATIVSCCDAFNAMTTDRSYRRAMPVDAALEELARCAGSQFNPVVVDVLIRVVERGRPAPPSVARDPARGADLDPREPVHAGDLAAREPAQL